MKQLGTVIALAVIGACGGSEAPAESPAGAASSSDGEEGAVVTVPPAEESEEAEPFVVEIESAPEPRERKVAEDAANLPAACEAYFASLERCIAKLGSAGDALAQSRKSLRDSWALLNQQGGPDVEAVKEKLIQVCAKGQASVGANPACD
jgi:hypothetical protein